jgi:hypothetical protein
MLGSKNMSKVMTSSYSNESTQSISIYPGSIHEFNISSQNVRDEIIKSLEIRFRENNITKGVIDHLKQFHKNSLEGCSEFIIILTRLAYTRLEFKTTRIDGDVIDYFLDKYSSKPPERFVKSNSKWFSLFGF